jgi:alginate O-acetyltransferase complex protein AlgI
MFGMHGISLPAAFAPELGSMRSPLEALGVQFTLGGGAQLAHTYAWVSLLGLIVFLAPNTQEIMVRWKPALAYMGRTASGRFAWHPSAPWLVVMGLAAAMGVLSLSHPTEFLYFQF